MRYFVILFLIINIYSQPIFSENIKKSDVNKNELSKLTLDVFLQTNDLDNAYKVAKGVVKKNPEDLYFRTKLAEISLWLNKTDEAFEHYCYLFEKGKSEELKNKVLKLSILNHSYEIAAKILKKEILDGNIKNLKDFIFVYEMTGESEEAIKILKDSYIKKQDKDIIKQIAKLQFNYGNIDEAMSSLEELREKYGFDIEGATMMASILCSNKKFKDAFDVLVNTKNKAKKENVDFWTILGDLAWIMSEYQIVFESYYTLYTNGNARSQDIERIALITKNTNPNISKEVSLYGWKKFRLPHLFFWYVNLSIDEKKWTDVNYIIKNLDGEELNLLKNNPYFWIIKATAHKNLDEYGEAKKSYFIALRFDSDSITEKIEFLWFLIERNDTVALEKYLSEIEKNETISREFYLPFAVGYYILQRYNIAIRYIKKVLKVDKDNPEILLLYADMLQLAGYDERAEYFRFKVYKYFSNRIIEDKELLKNPKIFSLYLRVVLYFEPPNKIKTLFEKARNILTEKEIKELELSWHIMRNNYDYSKYLVNKLKNVDGWIKLNLCLYEDDRYEQQDILYKNFKILSANAKIEPAIRTGDRKLAENIAHNAFEDNPDDFTMYTQLENFYIENAMNLFSDFSIVQRSSLRILKLDLKLKKYRYGKFNIEPFISIKNFLFNDENILVDYPSYDKSLIIFLKYDIEKENSFLFSTGIRDSIKSLLVLRASYNRVFKDLISVGFDIGYNKESDNSIYTTIAGTSDEIKISLTPQLTKRFFLNSSVIWKMLYLQNREYMGNSFSSYFDIQYKFRINYPDCVAKIYILKDIYDEKDEGPIKNSLTSESIKIFPQSFFETGIGFLFGTTRKDIFADSWSPYFETNLSYNSITETSYNFGIGARGPIISKDNININISFSRGFYNTKDYIYSISGSYIY